MTATSADRPASALDRAAIDRVDARGMLADVLAQPAQLEDALWRARSAALPRVDTRDGLLVCGMGGSAIGGDLARACVGERARRPIRVTRDYLPESWAGPETLVALASYSGDTEETLACYEATAATGAQRLVITTGGELAAAARADRVPVIAVPGGLAAPRAAVAYMTVATLVCAELAGAAPALDAEVEAAARLLSELADAWGPEGPADSPPRELAGRFVDSLAVVYGAGPTAPVARRWKTQLAENAKMGAFFSELPEAAHNEVCGYEALAAVALVQAVFLHDRTQDDRIARRMELTARRAAASGIGVYGVLAREQTAVERVMALVLCGDLASVYVAALRGVDPTPVAAIDELKRDVAGMTPARLPADAT